MCFFGRFLRFYVFFARTRCSRRSVCYVKTRHVTRQKYGATLEYPASMKPFSPRTKKNAVIGEKAKSLTYLKRPPTHNILLRPMKNQASTNNRYATICSVSINIHKKIDLTHLALILAYRLIPSTRGEENELIRHIIPVTPPYAQTPCSATRHCCAKENAGARREILLH